MKRILMLAAAALFAVACEAPKSVDSKDAAAGGETPLEESLVWTSRAYPTDERTASELLFERGMPKEVQVGQRYEYEIKLTNLTDMVLVNVVVADTAPEGFEASGAQVNGGVATWHVGEIEPGASKIVKASALASKPGTFRHVARATYEAPLAGTTLIVQPELKLERSVPEAVILVDGVPVKYVVSNAGTGTARDVVIEETLPEGFTAPDGSNQIRIEVGALPAGAKREVTRTVKAAGVGVFEGSAKATGFGGLSAETAKQPVRVAVPMLRAVATGPARAAIGQEYTLTVTVDNNGDGAALRTIAKFKLPEGATFVEGKGTDEDSVFVAGSDLNWHVGTIEPKGKRQLQIRMRADTAATAAFAGTIRTHGAEDTALSTTVEQYGIATVDISVSDEVDPVQKGSQAVYIVTVRNQGTAPATNVRLVCKLEEGLSLVDAAGASKGVAEGAQVVFEVVKELAPQATVSWRVVVKGDTAGDTRFVVEVKADQLDRPVEAAEATRFFE